ncbi:conserved protein of unknown function [Limnospira indica PCC 8005]|uniref:Uncharacterized protein n=1 Tax=Limnospira indica PCC 8005 TaxID=376219 RepID=A0A9P1KFQ5_9CYAN|nr:conserved protein of unknown function [Limnospira indica PCC 8005]
MVNRTRDGVVSDIFCSTAGDCADLQFFGTGNLWGGGVVFHRRAISTAVESPIFESVYAIARASGIYDDNLFSDRLSVCIFHSDPSSWLAEFIVNAGNHSILD